MNRYSRTATLLLLAAALVFSAGCQKKPPKGAKEMGTMSQAHATAMQDPTVSMNDDGSIQVGPLKSQFPKDWKSVQPSSSMRRAQFSLPAPNGDDGDAGEMTVFYFGPNAGGVEANITRWVGQFTKADGSALGENDVERTTMQMGGMPITIVKFKGTQKPSSMPGMAPTPERKNSMNISGIVMTPDGPWFFKGTGPEKTMEAQSETIVGFFHMMSYVGGHTHG